MHTCTRKTIQRFTELFKLKIIIIIAIIFFGGGGGGGRWGELLFNCLVFNIASTGKAGIFFWILNIPPIVYLIGKIYNQKARLFVKSNSVTLFWNGLL